MEKPKMEFKHKMWLVAILVVGLVGGYILGYSDGLHEVQEDNEFYEIACYKTCLTTNEVIELSNMQSELLGDLTEGYYAELPKLNCLLLKRE